MALHHHDAAVGDIVAAAVLLEALAQLTYNFIITQDLRIQSGAHIE